LSSAAVVNVIARLYSFAIRWCQGRLTRVRKELPNGGAVASSTEQTKRR
jgi:hypothetical protein